MARKASSRKETIRRKTREVYRDAILEAAEQIFAASGIQGARMADIAAAAGVATGTLYNYFENKQAIFHSLTELRLTEYNALLADACATASSPEDALRAVVRSTFGFLDEHRAMYHVVVELGGASLMGLRVIGGPAAAQQQDIYLRVYGQLVGDLLAAGRLRDDIGHDRLTAFLIGTMTGLVQDWVLARDERPLAERADLICDLFLSGAGARE